MTRFVPRRSVLASLAAMPVALMLASCSDSGDTAEAPKPAEPAAPKVEAPKPAGSVDMAKLLEPGALPE